MASRYFDALRPIAFAHRGGAKCWPENTLTAFAGALKAGCRYIETDIHLSRDGEVLLFHDPLLGRTTDGKGALAELTAKELRRLDAGFHFRNERGEFEFRGQGVRIPTLGELAELDPDLCINLEIKPNAPEVPRRLLEEIDALGIADRVLVASETHGPLAEFRRLAGDRIPTSASRREIITFLAQVRVGLAWPTKMPIPYSALQVPPRYYAIRVIDSAFVTAAHRHGVHVHAWTIDSAEQMRSLLRVGVDGIMSDLPELLTSTLECASGA